MIEQERDLLVANQIKEGKCPFGMLQEGQTMAHCPHGFPGCGCADEMMLNPNFDQNYDDYVLEPIKEDLTDDKFCF